MKSNRTAMKKIIPVLVLSLCVAFTSCNDEYDADTAQSNYQPAPGKRVESLKTTYAANGNDYSFEHLFSYDAQGRIKEVNSNIVHYVATPEFYDTVYVKCYITSRANYFYDGDKLDVEYSVSREYPDASLKYTSENGTDYGVFNSAGVLTRFSSLTLDYNTTSLQRGYADGDVFFNVIHNADGDVSGYIKKRTSTDEIIEDKANRYFYSSIKNKTNFDFSAYFGYWGVEQAVRMISIPYYATYQLAAFGMMGATSRHLPLGIIEKGTDGKDNYIYGEWEFDSAGYPLSFVDVNGRRTEITYGE